MRLPDGKRLIKKPDPISDRANPPLTSFKVHPNTEPLYLDFRLSQFFGLRRGVQKPLEKVLKN
jgi:hypothetical protein